MVLILKCSRTNAFGASYLIFFVLLNCTIKVKFNCHLSFPMHEFPSIHIPGMFSGFLVPQFSDSQKYNRHVFLGPLKLIYVR